MIRPIELILALGVCAPPSLAQLSPDIQEQVDKIHLGSGGPMIPIEQSAVFERTAAGDYRHKPSGFVCPHAAAAIGEWRPGLTTIFDDPASGHDVGCGVIAHGVSISVFVFDPPKALAEVFDDERNAARRSNPPRDLIQPKPVLPADYGLPAGTPLANDTWIDTSGKSQSVSVARIGQWYVHVRVTADAAQAGMGLDETRLLFAQASQQIAR